MSKFLVTIFLAVFSTVTWAEQIGYADADVDDADDFQFSAQPTHSVKTMLLETHSDPNISLKNKPTQCNLIREGGYVRVDISDGGPFLQNRVYGAGFPSELVDIEKPLKNGFKNQVEITTMGITATWTAEFKNGVLTIENIIRGPNMKPAKLHFEAETSSTLLEAEKISGNIEPNTPKIKPSNFSCGTLPLS